MSPFPRKKKRQNIIRNIDTSVFSHLLLRKRRFGHIWRLWKKEGGEKKSILKLPPEGEKDRRKMCQEVFFVSASGKEE